MIGALVAVAPHRELVDRDLVRVQGEKVAVREVVMRNEDLVIGERKDRVAARAVLLLGLLGGQ